MDRTKKFEWVDSDIDGHEGWRPVGMPHFNAGANIIVAHDTLEHVTDKEPFKYELMAFGHTIYGRLRDPHIGSYDISTGDLVGFLIKREFSMGDIPEPPARWMKPLADVQAEADIQRFMTLAGSNAKHEEMFGKVTYYEAEMDRKIPARATPEQREACLRRCEGWIRLGYRIAARLSGGGSHNRRAYAKLFQTLFEVAADEHDAIYPAEGDTLTVTFNRQTLRFKMYRERDGKRITEATYENGEAKLRVLAPELADPFAKLNNLIALLGA